MGNTESAYSPYCPRSWGYIFKYCPVDKAIPVGIVLIENFAAAELGNAFSLKNNIIPFNFLYYNV